MGNDNELNFIAALTHKEFTTVLTLARTALRAFMDGAAKNERVPTEFVKGLLDAGIEPSALLVRCNELLDVLDKLPSDDQASERSMQ